MNLENFLQARAVPVANQKFAASARFVDAQGQPELWEIKCLNAAADEALRLSSAVKNPANPYQPETDYALYLGKLAAACTVYPNLLAADLQASYGVMGADALLKAMLTPGEYADYLARVEELNGFNLDFAGLVEQAKN